MKPALLAVFAVAALGSRAGEANIDTDGFVQDGRTTYCQAVTTDQGPLQFLSLSPSSAGKCPVSLELNARAQSFSMADRTLDVSWTASLQPSATLFPGVLNKTSEPVRVVLRACRVGSNCATDVDVVVPTGLSQDPVGGLDPSGAKTLPGGTITLPSANEYVLVGKVTLAGEQSPTDVVVFKRISVEVEVRPGTVQPVDGSKAGGLFPQALAGVAGPPANTPGSPAASPASGDSTVVAANATPSPLNFRSQGGEQPSAPKPPGGGSSNSEATTSKSTNDVTSITNAYANANANASPISAALSTPDNGQGGSGTSTADGGQRTEASSTPNDASPSPEGAPVDPKGGDSSSVGSVTSNGSEGDSTTTFVSIAAALVVVVAAVLVVVMRVRKARRNDSESNAVLSDSLYVAPAYVDVQAPQARDTTTTAATTMAAAGATAAPHEPAATHQGPNPRYARASSAQSSTSTNTSEHMEFTLNSKNEPVFIADFT